MSVATINCACSLLGWFDKYTRAFFIELGVYNVNVNLFTRIQLLTEISHTALAIHSSEFTTFQLYRFVLLR